MASVRYSYTITLKPVLYKFKAEEQYDKTYCRIATELGSFSTFTLIAECTKGFNVHYHGTISFNECTKNCMKKFVDYFRGDKEIGYVNIKQITDEPGWIDYISKSIKDTCIALNRRPIIMDDFDYFTSDDYALYGTEW